MLIRNELATHKGFCMRLLESRILQSLTIPNFHDSGRSLDTKRIFSTISAQSSQDKTILEVLRVGDPALARLLVRQHTEVSPSSLQLSASTSAALFNFMIDHFSWDDAYTIAVYMLNSNYGFSGRGLYYLLGNLLTTEVGTTRLLELMSLSAQCHRHDVAGFFSYGLVR